MEFDRSRYDDRNRDGRQCERYHPQFNRHGKRRSSPRHQPPESRGHKGDSRRGNPRFEPSHAQEAAFGPGIIRRILLRGGSTTSEDLRSGAPMLPEDIALLIMLVLFFGVIAFFTWERHRMCIA